MKDYIRERVLEEAYYIICSKDTIRKTANKFKVSKTTVHVDMTERLPKVNHILYIRVRNILIYNRLDRAIRGGIATKKLYRKIA